VEELYAQPPSPRVIRPAAERWLRLPWRPPGPGFSIVIKHIVRLPRGAEPAN